MAQTVANPAECVETEAAALRALAERMRGPMAAAVEAAVSRAVQCAEAGGRVVAIGVGKSGIVAQKFAATLNSLGTPAQFVHAGEAMHGDAGAVTVRDLVFAFSYSGETEELLETIAGVRGHAAGVIAVCGCVDSSLSKNADTVLDVSVDAEACSMNLAPTASTTAMMALGDAIAIAAGARRGFAESDFARLHPGGRLGKRLQRVSALMHAGDRMPRVAADAAMTDVIHEMSAKRLGMTTVADTNGKLLGVVSDGDLRRLLEREGGDALKRTAQEMMTREPATVSEDAFASAALEVMEARKITALVVARDGVAVGVLHLHDLWEK